MLTAFLKRYGSILNITVTKIVKTSEKVHCPTVTTGIVPQIKAFPPAIIVLILCLGIKTSIEKFSLRLLHTPADY